MAVVYIIFLSANLACLPFVSIRGGFCLAGIVRCASTICLVCAFRGGFRGFPRLAFCSRRCGRSAFHLFRFSVCHYVGRVPAVSVRPSGVMILSRLARLPSVFALFRLSGLPAVVCYPLRLFRLSGFTFHHIAAVLLSTYPTTLILPYFAFLLRLWCCMP